MRNATAVPGPYKVGDIVSYSRAARAGESGLQWSVGSRIIGFEVDDKQEPSDDTPRNAWVICDGLPVLVATHKLRPCTAAELLAFQYMNAQRPQVAPVNETRQQQRFIDARDDVTHSTAQSSSSASTTTLAMQQVKRKELREMTPEQPAEEELRDPFTPQNPLAQQLTKAKVTGKGVEMVERIAKIQVQDGDDPNRIAFLQVRLIGPKEKRRSKKPPRAKDGDKNLKYADCTPEIQKGLRKAICEEWQKWMKYNAGVVLTIQELEHLRSQGVTVQPMQWVETDKNAHKRRKDNKVKPLLKSRLVGCGNFEDTQGLRTDSPTSDVDAHNLVISWVASNKLTIRKADIQSAYLQGKPVDRVILYPL